MNDHDDSSTNRDLHTFIEPELEARIVAWELGEASPFEAAELERLVAEKPELAVFKRRIEAVHGLAGAAARPDETPLRLAPERRKQVLAAIGGRSAEAMTPARPATALRRRRKPRVLWLPILTGIAACAIVAALMIPTGRTVMELSQSTTADHEEQRRVRQATLPAGEPPPPASAPFAEEELVGHNALERPLPHARPGPLRMDQVRSMPVGTNRTANEDLRDRHLAGSWSAPEPRTRSEYEFADSAPPPTLTSRQASTTEPSSLSFRVGSFGDVDSVSVNRGPRSELFGEVPRNALRGFNSESDARGRNEFAAASRPGAYPAPAVRISGGSGAIGGDGGEVVELSPFSVESSSDDVGYYATSTLSGSRMNTNLGHLASSVSVVTNQNLEDTASVSLNDVFRYDANTEGTQNYSRPQDGADGEFSGSFADANTGRFSSRYGDAMPRSSLEEPSLAGTFTFSNTYTTGAGAKSQTLEAQLKELQQERREALERKRARENAESRIATAPTVVELHKTEPEDLRRVNGELRSLIDIDANTDEADELLRRMRTAALSDEIQAADEPVSTFSLHVSDASYRIAQAALARGELPDPARIRPEEFYNAFDYGDPAPTMAEMMACRIEQSVHPVLQQRNLVRIAMKVPATGRAAGQPLRLTVLLDTSGSMEREDRVASVKSAMNVLASLLGANDRATLITFARQPRLVAEQIPGDQAARLVDLVAATPSEGGTNLEEALKLAGELARRQQDESAQNRIVLLTDGAANLGNDDPEQLASMIEMLRQQGIAFDACGVGTDGMDDAILEALTRKGDGRYYVLDTAADADAGFARQLAGAFRPAAENVKVQVRFNPARVGSYRLIGFEQHQLREEDFRNDQVDAAELAAEEAAVALYQIEALPQGEGDLGEVFVRFRDAAAGSMIERSWTMRYDDQARAFDRATPSMQLAGTVALIAEKLQGGAMADLVRLDELAPVINSLRGHYAKSPQVQGFVGMFEHLRRTTGE